MMLLLPLLAPLVGAALGILTFRMRNLQRWLGAVGATGQFLGSVWVLRSVSRNGIQAVQMGDWPAPFGITLVADLLSAIMLVLAGLIGVAVVVYSLAGADRRSQSFGYYPLLNVLLLGVSGAFLSGDIFNLYVWFEVMLMASFVLLSLGGGRSQLEGAIKYFTLNLMASALFLAAVGVLYGATGTLNMADLSVKMAGLENPGTASVISVLFLVAFGIKAGLFPLFFWLPASYHTPPFAVSALFAGLLTKVGVYALIRIYTLLFTQEVEYTHTLLLALSGLTMLSGVLGALAQNEIRRVLSFHIISQIGYMVMGLALFSPLAVAGAVFYIVHHILVKTNLFLIGGVVERLQGSEKLKQLGGLYRANPGLAFLFMVPALSLAGLPPLSGFFAKLALVQAGLSSRSYWIVAVALIVSLLTLMSMTKIWAEAFWKPRPADWDDLGDAVNDSKPLQKPPTGQIFLLMLPIAALTAATLALSLAAETVFGLAVRTAEQLLDPSDYISSVLRQP